MRRWKVGSGICACTGEAACKQVGCGRGRRLQRDITFLASFTVPPLLPLLTPFVSVSSPPAPRNASLSYQQLHQQVDQHHPPSVFSCSEIHPATRLQGLRVKFPLSWRQPRMSAACWVVRRGAYLLPFSTQQCWINRVTGWKSIKDSADWHRAACLYTSNNTIPRKRSVLKSLDLPIVVPFVLCWRSGTFLNTPQALCHQLTALNTYGTGWKSHKH